MGIEPSASGFSEKSGGENTQCAAQQSFTGHTHTPFPNNGEHFGAHDHPDKQVVALELVVKHPNLEPPGEAITSRSRYPSPPQQSKASPAARKHPISVNSSFYSCLPQKNRSSGCVYSCCSSVIKPSSVASLYACFAPLSHGRAPSTDVGEGRGVGVGGGLPSLFFLFSNNLRVCRQLLPSAETRRWNQKDVMLVSSWCFHRFTAVVSLVWYF